MEITVFGSGCARCKALEKLVTIVVNDLKLDVAVTKTSDPKQMLQAGILATPALAVNGTICCTGRIPERAEIEQWLAYAQTK